jgi:hypothetical protein
MRHNGIGALAAAVLLAFVLALLSLQIKTPGTAAVRPLYYGAIALLFVTTLFSAPGMLRVARRMQAQAWILFVWLALLYLYMLVHALPMSTRALRDFVLGASVDAGCFILVLGSMVISYSFRHRALRYIALAISAFGLVASAVAWLGYFGYISIELYGQEFPHNPAWATRIHGWLGEPTQLGAAAGLGVLATMYLVAGSVELKPRVAGYVALVFLGATLYGAGSRNGLLSTIVATIVMVILSRHSRRTIAAAALATFVGGFLMMILMVSAAGPEWEFMRRLGARFPGYSLAELHLIEAFRFNDPAGSVARLEKFARVVEIYLHNSPSEQLIGAGYGFTRVVYGAAQNDYLESIVDFGALFLAMLIGYFAYLQRLLLGMTRYADAEGILAAVFGNAALAFSIVFALNQSSLFPDLFQFANFAHLLAAAVVVAAHVRPA